MFGRNGGRSVVAGAASEVSGYGSELVEDEKLRRRLVAALAAGAAVRRRAKRQAKTPKPESKQPALSGSHSGG